MRGETNGLTGISFIDKLKNWPARDRAGLVEGCFLALRPGSLSAAEGRSACPSLKVDLYCIIVSRLGTFQERSVSDKIRKTPSRTVYIKIPLLPTSASICIRYSAIFFLSTQTLLLRNIEVVHSEGL